jgi:hypothetical protein
MKDFMIAISETLAKIKIEEELIMLDDPGWPLGGLGRDGNLTPPPPFFKGSISSSKSSSSSFSSEFVCLDFSFSSPTSNGIDCTELSAKHANVIKSQITLKKIIDKVHCCLAHSLQSYFRFIQSIYRDS